MSRQSKVILSLFTLLVVAVFVFFTFWTKTPTEPRTEHRIEIPSIQSESVINDVPDDLKILIPAEAKETVIKKIIYINSKFGFSIDFVSSSPLIKPPSTYLSSVFNSNSGWIPIGLGSNKTTLTSIFKAENNKYTIKITEVLTQDKLNHIKVNVIEN